MMETKELDIKENYNSEELIKVIDDALSNISQRDLVSSSEMRDTLLDIRNIVSVSVN